jgi:hypothetical protein
MYVYISEEMVDVRRFRVDSILKDICDHLSAPHGIPNDTTQLLLLLCMFI